MSRGRLWAWAALAALALLATLVLVQAAASFGSLVPLVLAAGIVMVLAPLVSWFAITTRTAWKRFLSLAAGAAILAALAWLVVAFTMAQIGGVVVIMLVALAFRAAARRAVRATLASLPRAGARTQPWLLVNPQSGGGTAGRVGLVAAAEAAGFRVDVLERGDDPASLARRAAAGGADVLAVAGGDGTLAQVAAVAVDLDLPFLCVPAGTRNHFAKDLGLDRDDPLGALCALDGPEVRVDAAFVADRLFLNNVSLGAYADVVAEPRYRDHKFDTSRVVMRRLVRGERAPAAMTVVDIDGRRHDGLHVLQVANNRYRLRRFGGRAGLDDGVLQVSALRTRHGAALAGLAARAALGRAGTAKGWAQWETTALTVETPLTSLAAGVDGEAVTLDAPLEFHIRPQALRVLVPAAVRLPGVWRLATRRHGHSPATAASRTVVSPIATRRQS